MSFAAVFLFTSIFQANLVGDVYYTQYSPWTKIPYVTSVEYSYPSQK